MSRRLLITTACGLLCALFCLFADQSWGLAQLGGPQAPWPVVIQIIFARTLIGFAIGISCLRIGNWAVHGAVLGFIFSLPLAFSCLMTPEYAEVLFALTFFFGILYGLFIEFVATVVFKEPQPYPCSAPQKDPEKKKK